jgi:hypothetical protein
MVGMVEKIFHHHPPVIDNIVIPGDLGGHRFQRSYINGVGKGGEGILLGNNTHKIPIMKLSKRVIE